MREKTKRHHRLISLICTIVMAAGLLNPMVLKNSAVEIQAAPTGAIEIDTPEELLKIGKDAAYPMDGDYVLTADLDMTGIDYTPIGGMIGEKGAVAGDNVFSGTFDGQGHLISNLTIDIEYTYSGAQYVQVGMFSIVASDNESDYAVVKNIVFGNGSITTDIVGGYTAAGMLAGEVNGYATIENIAVLDGSVYINGMNQSDTVGAGGLIGECRTNGAMGNRYITIKNIYNGSEVLAGSTAGGAYAAGVVGRVRGSECKEISGCINVGRTGFRGELGTSIAAFADISGSCLSNCYFLFASGEPSGSAVELEEKAMKTATLLEGLDPEVWYASEGSYPLLKICQNEGPSGYLGLMSLAPEFAGDENASCVTQDFTLPGSVGDVKVTWTSSNPGIIEIDGTTAKVKSAMAETRVILTAKTSDGKTRNYTIIVLSNVDAKFDQLYAKAGTPLTVTIKNAPADLKCTYTWSVGDKTLPAVTGNSYTPTEDDKENFIKVVVKAANYDATWEESIYMSDLPVVYIDTEDGQDVINKDVYKYANIKIQGNDQFSTEDVLYDGLTQIKGRGNSTWDYAASNGLKKPYRLKFDGKADVLGMGKSKHWVLLANVIDHTNMRNELIYQFADDIGMECVLSFEPCVVILNGQYHGFYQIGEHKRVDEGRIEIFDWEGLGEDIAAAIADKEGITGDAFDDFEEYVGALDFSWLDTGVVNYNGKSYTVSDYYKGTIPEFTGGFAFDMDFRLGQSKFISKFYTDYGYPMFFEAPEYAKTSPTMMKYAQEYLQAFEDAIHDDDYYVTYDGEELHYSELYDIESLMQNWYVVEYSMNWDAMKNSTLMYKDLDTEEGRSLMKMGPVWDFDWAWGNMNMYSNDRVWVTEGWHTTRDNFCEISYQYENWNRYLISDPYFAMLAYEAWPEVRAVMEDMIKDGGRIDQLEEYYRDASYANDERWAYSYNRYGGYGVTNGNVVRKQSEEFDEAVVTMEYFVKNRVKWFDTQFTSVENLLKSWGRYQGSNALQVSDIVLGDDGKNVITAATSNANAKKIAFYVNGIRAGEADVVDGEATITVEDTALRASADGEALDNCVQIRALDADGNFLKNGSAVMTNYDIFEKYVEDTSGAGQIADSIVINEVESDDPDGGNDWVELYNKGDEAVDISGWFITDDKGLERLTKGDTTPLPEGTVLEPGAFYILEENVNFTCGLGSGDTVYLFDAKSNQIDIATWTGHAEGVIARVPDGIGEFVDQSSSKGITNNPVVLNEIESNDDYDGNDWVELYNKSDKAVDISGYFITDDKGLDRFTSNATTPLPEGTILEPGAFYVLEENVNFTCGLGGGDTVYLYNADQVLLEVAGWNDHAEGTLAKLPDGTGAFVDQTSTKGISNSAGTDADYVNKDGLKSAIAVAEKLIKANYTEDTWAGLESALAKAKDVLADENAVQKDVDAAAQALVDAQKALVEVVVDDSVVINEIESSDPNEGNDWVELYNKSDKAVDISGWFVTDDKGLDRLASGDTTPLPEGTVLQPGEFYVLEENIHFNCGLGSADTVYLYNAASMEVDSCGWEVHAAEGLSRVPDGTGDFVDQPTTKGAKNEVKAELPKVLADFNFDADGEAFDGGNAQAAGTYSLVDHGEGKALKLAGNGQFLTVTKKDGSSLLTGVDAMTVSFQFKPERSSTNWAFFAAPSDAAPSYPNEHYIGIFDNNGNVGIERYDNAGGRPANPAYAAGYDGWYYVTAVLTALEDGTAETILYVDGVEKARESSVVDIAAMLGENSILYIGKATWTGGEYANALIDNYKIYSYALNASEVAEEANKYLETPIPVPVDKSYLQKEVDAELPADQAEKYTEETWQSYQDKLSAAKAVLTNEEADQAAVDAALDALVKAKNALEEIKKTDKTALQAEVDAAIPMDQADNYTEGSWLNYLEKLGDAKEVLKNEDAEQAEVDAALAALTEAKADLEAAKIKWPFIDVAETDWFYTSVKYTNDAGVMTGVDNDEFKPYDMIVRGQFASIVHRLAGEEEVTFTPDFPDVTEGDWFMQPVLWAKANGVVSGYQNGSFGPNDNIIREQIAIMLHNYATYKEYDTTAEAELDDFVDGGQVSSWAEPAMKWAVANGIISGTSEGELKPHADASRAECAAMIMNFMETFVVETEE